MSALVPAGSSIEHVSSTEKTRGSSDDPNGLEGNGTMEFTWVCCGIQACISKHDEDWVEYIGTIASGLHLNTINITKYYSGSL